MGIEMLLHGTESLNVCEVMLSWEGLCLLLAGELRLRTHTYMEDILLRLGFSYLTFLVSGPPAALEGECEDERDMLFVSPVVAAMTAAEWNMVQEIRPTMCDVLACAASLLGGKDTRLEELLAQLEGRFSMSTCHPATVAELRSFAP